MHQSYQMNLHTSEQKSGDCKVSVAGWGETFTSGYNWEAWLFNISQSTQTKRLNIPCGVISSPVHIQNFPLSYKPFLGYEGTNQIADLIYNSFTLGMEDHLIELFGGHDTTEALTATLSADDQIIWSSDAQKELNKIPGFVRGKIKRNTEKFASSRNLNKITLEVMYDAKETVGA